MRSIHSITIALLASVLLVSCSNQVEFMSSSVVPGARGDVKISQDKNDNYVIKVDITNLADPSALNPPKNAYVVWMETPENDIRRLGQIKTSSPVLSKAMKASFEAVSTIRPKRVFITAEDNVAVTYPGREVLTTGPIDA